MNFIPSISVEIYGNCMVIVGKYTIHAIQIDPVGLIQVPKVTAVTAASACRVFCRFLTATADEQLREDSTKRVVFVVCILRGLCQSYPSRNYRRKGR